MVSTGHAPLDAFWKTAEPQTVEGTRYIPMPYIVQREHAYYPCFGCAACTAEKDDADLQHLCNCLSAGCGGMIHGCVFIEDTEAGRLQYVIDKLEA